MFYQTDDMEFCRTLEEQDHVIERELGLVPSEFFRPWIEQDLHTGGWLILPLFLDGPHEELERQCERNRVACPRTTTILQGISGMVGAAFSRMLPGTQIYPHRGLERDVYRCHLPLTIPTDCALRFGTDTRSWKRGECLVFEDTALHDCWNEGATERTVLLTDFAKSSYPVRC